MLEQKSAVLLFGRTLGQQTVFGELKAGKKERRKTILLVGAKSCGKSALVNSVTNYLYKINEDAAYRLHVVGRGIRRDGLEMEATTSVHSYVFHGTRLSSSIALIDTPPLGQPARTGKETAKAKILKWYTSYYDFSSKDFEIWLVVSALQPSITREFMFELAEILEEFGPKNIKVTPVVTFSKNRKPILTIKSLESLGFQTQLENVDFFMVNNESILATGGVMQTNSLPMKESLRNIRSLIIASSEPIVHILGNFTSASSSKSISPSEIRDQNNNQSAKSVAALHRSQTLEDHVYATPKKARPSSVTRYAVRPSISPLQRSRSASHANLVAISPYETVV